MNKNTLLAMAALAASGCVTCATADELKARVTFGDNEIRLYTSPLAYEVVKGGQTVVLKTGIGLKLDGVCCKDAKPLRVDSKSLTGSVATPIYKKSAVDLSGIENYVDFGDFGIRLVARKDGVAYRFETKKPVTVTFENAPLTIPAKARCWFNRTGNIGCEETVPEFADAANLKTDPAKVIYLPFAYGVDGKVVAVTESDVYDYPIWNFRTVERTGDGVKLGCDYARYPKTTERIGGWGSVKGLSTGGRWVKVTASEDYLVKATSARTYPWRTFVLGEKPADLLGADIVFALARPQADGADFSWVKPGKVAWDWWNCFDNAPQGAPNGGCTTKTYERFIDFAAKTGVEYVIFDEGWSEALNIWKFHPEVDVPHLIDYAEKKGVGIILWMAWAQVYGEEEKVAEHFAKLGAKGFKVDFMDRGDARVTQFLADFAAACAKHKMVVDYHGAYRPNGLHRQFPNVLNYEGIHGLEQMKWSKPDKDMPYNDVACSFLRMTAGPMDYTPGAMLNQVYGQYTAGPGARFPGSVGTRCHQMAMMVAYEAPLQMLSDSPTNYEKNMECFEFMAQTPVVWANSVGLGGCPETCALIARQAKDGSWYAAGLNNKDARQVEVDTSFLGTGTWKVESFVDTKDGDVNPCAYRHTTGTPVNVGSKMVLNMAPGGGFVVKFTR